MKLFWITCFMTVVQLTFLVAQQPYARQFTDEDGLPSLTIYEITQDEKGFLWLATNNGFCRYDGIHFIEYKSEKAIDKEFIGAYISPTHTIWTWNISGQLFRVKGKKLELYEPLIGKEMPQIDKLLGDKSGNIYLSIQQWSQNVFFVCNTNNDSCYSRVKYSELKDFLHFYKKIAQDNTSIVNSRLTNYQGYSSESSSRKIIFEKGGSISGRFDFYPAKNGSVYGFNRKSRNIFTINTNNNGSLNIVDLKLPVFHNTSKKGFNIRFFYEDKNENIWIIDEEQLYIFNKKHELTYQNATIFKGIQVNYFFEDNEGGYWVGTNSKGLFYIPSFQMQTFSNSELLLNGSPIVKLIGEGNDILAITSQGTIFRLRDNQVQIAKKIDSGFTIFKPKKYGKGYWFNSINQGLFELDANFNKKKKIYFNLGAIKDLEERKDELLIGNQRNFIHLKKNDFSNEYAEKPLQKRVYAIHSKNEQTALIGAVDGLYIFENNEITPFHLSHSSEPFSHWITAIKSYQKLNIIATKNSGLFFLKNDQLFKHFNQENGLLDNHCEQLFIDDYDRLWVTSPKGLSIIDLKTMKINTLNKANGLPSSNINAVYSKNNKVWVSSSKGLTTFNFEDISFEKVDFPIIVSNIKIAGQSQKLQNSYTLSHDENTIYIEFLSPSYKNQGDILYSYRMVGLDESWQFTNKNFVQYDRLKPDDYQFKVRTTTNEGSENGVVKRINIRIKKSIYNTFGFYLVLFTIIGLMAFAGFRVWLSFYKKRQEKEAYFNRQFSELKISALQSQMNPHFIFNALNAIQHFFTTNDRESAMLYLGKFARLIRLIFEYSKTSSITLAQELNFLTLYLQLEKLRFGKKIKIELVGMDIIEKEYILIPPLLIQPIVENAFKHGLLHKETGGELLIKFEKIGEKMLRVLILDNGIGREKAKEYSAWKPKEYKSSGVQTIKERVRLANHDSGKKDIKFNIIDLKDDYNQPIGTKVEFVFKIKKIINEYEDEELDE